MRAGGASLREIGEAMGISAATAMRDARAAGASGSSPETPEHGETASDGVGVGMSTGAVDMSDYAAVEREYTRVYGLLSAGERIPASQVRLLTTRHAELLKREQTCAEHMTWETYLDEVRWRDGIWMGQLELAARRLTASGAKGAETVLNDMLTRVGEITKVGRPQNRTG